MTIRWLEAHMKENNRQEMPTKEQLQKLDCPKDLDLFETMCKILNISMEVKKDVGEETTDAMVMSQHDCMVVRTCQKAYVEARQSVQ